jgi:hypothetical protein
MGQCPSPPRPGIPVVAMAAVGSRVAIRVATIKLFIVFSVVF